MTVLKDLVRNVIVIILLTTFLDMLLPSSSMQRFVKVVMGIFVLVTLLTPLTDLLTSGEELSVFNWYPAEQNEEYTAVLQDSGRLAGLNRELFLKNYALRVEKQMETLVLLVEGVREAAVKVRLLTDEKDGTYVVIDNVDIMVREGAGPEQESTESYLVKPVKIDLSDAEKNSDGSGSETEENGKKEGHEAQSAAERYIVGEIKKTIAQYYGLKPKQIKVTFTAADP